MNSRAAIWIAILFTPFVIFVAVTLLRRLQASRCPQCGRYGARTSGPMYPHGASSDSPGIALYRCQQCGHTWSQPAPR